MPGEVWGGVWGKSGRIVVGGGGAAGRGPGDLPSSAVFPSPRLAGLPDPGRPRPTRPARTPRSLRAIPRSASARTSGPPRWPPCPAPRPGSGRVHCPRSRITPAQWKFSTPGGVLVGFTERVHLGHLAAGVLNARGRHGRVHLNEPTKALETWVCSTPGGVMVGFTRRWRRRRYSRSSAQRPGASWSGSRGQSRTFWALTEAAQRPGASWSGSRLSELRGFPVKGDSRKMLPVQEGRTTRRRQDRSRCGSAGRAGRCSRWARSVGCSGS